MSSISSEAAHPLSSLPDVPLMSHPVILVAKYSSQGKPGCRSVLMGLGGPAARPSSPSSPSLRALPESYYLRNTFPKMQRESGQDTVATSSWGIVGHAPGDKEQGKGLSFV